MLTQIESRSQPADRDRPVRADERACSPTPEDVQAILRDVAFVLHLTRKVTTQLREEKAGCITGCLSSDQERNWCTSKSASG